MLENYLSILQKTFGHPAFRPGQSEVLSAIAEGRDVLTVMPTGSGKSACFQLPAIASEGLSLVISPLQALMRDQVEALRRKGVPGVDFLNGLMTPDEQAERLREVSAGALRLLYVAPERFGSPLFVRALARNKVSLVAIDEAHCISQWGHDFRPEYRELAPILEGLPDAARLALTATASPKVRDDIVVNLRLRNPLRVVLSADRPNLRLEVETCPSRSKPERIVKLCKEIEGSIIVYAGRRQDADDLAKTLRGSRVQATAYHAGMEPDDRRRVQDGFLSGKTRVVCATVAFGMGIDKPDVRAVIHHRHPAALEGYYQEFGRAGRDGDPSRCILLHAEKDSGLHRFFISNAFPTLEEHRSIYALLRKGVSPEAMEQHDEDLIASKVKVALRTLEQAGYVAKEGRSYRPATPADPKPLDLSSHDVQRRHAFELLQHMIDYAESETCLRARLLDYFGEDRFAGCKACGPCLGLGATRKKKRGSKKKSGPPCPKCDGEMRKRKNGEGRPFWGCKRYPLCKGTINIA